MRRTRRPSLVEQVRTGLLDDIRSGRLAHGAKLPNEYDLAEQYHVSRATMREAIQGLLETGHLSRQRGTGTFVAAAPSRHALDTTVSYTAMIREAGHEPSETVLHTDLRAPTAGEAQRLAIGEEDRVVEIERIRYGDGRPLIYSRDRIPEAVLGDTSTEMLGNSLYVVLEWAGHEVVRATAHLMPTTANAKLSRLLEVKPRTPLLHIRQTDRDAAGRAVMLSDEWHVADAFELIVNRRERSAASDE
jgi:GntR family transcriptional regulator